MVTVSPEEFPMLAMATEGEGHTSTNQTGAHMEKYKDAGHSAFILGATGLVGKELVKEIVRAKLFTRVVLITRREVDLPVGIKDAVEQRIVDFDQLDEHSDAFKDLHVGFCCLGTTKTKAGSDEALYKVDHDYVLNAAKLAHAGGCIHFHLISTILADKDAYWFMSFYRRTKREVECKLEAMKFKRLSIYRPGGLLGEREDSRPAENTFMFLIQPLAWLSPTSMTTPATTVAKAMMNCTVLPQTRDVEIFEISGMFLLAGNPGGLQTDPPPIEGE